MHCQQILEQLLDGLDGVDHSAAARTIIAHFGSLKEALAAPAIAQLRVCDNLRVVRMLRAVQRAAFWMQRRELDERISLASARNAFEYLHLTLGMESREQVRLLLLDARNGLIRDELLGQGGVSSCPMEVRDVVMRGLEAGAAAMILAHNHPSGEPNPSQADIEITRRVAQGAQTVEMRLVDHIIVTRAGCTSLRTKGLI